MIGVQRDLKANDKNYRAFEILNLGKYERQHYIGINPNLNEEQQQLQLAQKSRDYQRLILRAYAAQPVEQSGVFHGKKAGRMVAIGPINLPVTRLFVEEVVAECLKKQITRADILAFEFEMGLFPQSLDTAKENGVDLAPKYIPAEVFDKRAVEREEVLFHDVSYIEAEVLTKKNAVAVKLTDFLRLLFARCQRKSHRGLEKRQKQNHRRSRSNRKTLQRQSRQDHPRNPDQRLAGLDRLLGGGL